IICAGSDNTLGTPNGQAISQLRQATHRGLSEECTMPSSERLIASAGQTSAQGGLSQCMHTMGTVAVLAPRSRKATCTMGTPRCVSHSAQAASHDRQPMQRDGSM